MLFNNLYDRIRISEATEVTYIVHYLHYLDDTSEADHHRCCVQKSGFE